jgi:hypothetical protein
LAAAFFVCGRKVIAEIILRASPALGCLLRIQMDK